MNDKEKTLVDKYLAYKKTEEEAKTKASEVLRELSLLAPHQVGEIIKWTETKRKRVGGTIWRPIYEDTPPVEKKAVLTYVKAEVWRWINGSIDFKYHYDFSPIKKDGSISQQNCYPRSDYEWTGEIYKEEQK